VVKRALGLQDKRENFYCHIFWFTFGIYTVKHRASLVLSMLCYCCRLKKAACENADFVQSASTIEHFMHTAAGV